MNFNLYHYAGNNPVKYSDPDGNFVNLAAAGIGALIGAGTGAIIAACSGASGREIAAAAVGGATGAMAGAVLGEVAFSIGNKLNTPQVHIDSTKYPETAQHIKDAQNNGYPSKLTIDRAGAKANRAGASMGNQLRNYPDGTVIKMVVD